MYANPDDAVSLVPMARLLYREWRGDPDAWLDDQDQDVQSRWIDVAQRAYDRVQDERDEGGYLIRHAERSRCRAKKAEAEVELLRSMLAASEDSAVREFERGHLEGLREAAGDHEELLNSVRTLISCMAAREMKKQSGVMEYTSRRARGR